MRPPLVTQTFAPVSAPAPLFVSKAIRLFLRSRSVPVALIVRSHEPFEPSAVMTSRCPGSAVSWPMTAPLMVVTPQTAVAASMRTVSPAVIVQVSVAAGATPPQAVHVPAVVQLPVAPARLLAQALASASVDPRAKAKVRTARIFLITPHPPAVALLVCAVVRAVPLRADLGRRFGCLRLLRQDDVPAADLQLARPDDNVEPDRSAVDTDEIVERHLSPPTVVPERASPASESLASPSPGRPGGPGQPKSWRVDGPSCARGACGSWAASTRAVPTASQSRRRSSDRRLGYAAAIPGWFRR